MTSLDTIRMTGKNSGFWVIGSKALDQSDRLIFQIWISSEPLHRFWSFFASWYKTIRVIYWKYAWWVVCPCWAQACPDLPKITQNDLEHVDHSKDSANWLKCALYHAKIIQHFFCHWKTLVIKLLTSKILGETDCSIFQIWISCEPLDRFW